MYQKMHILQRMAFPGRLLKDPSRKKNHHRWHEEMHQLFQPETRK
jgi:hypothetical protein